MTDSSIPTQARVVIIGGGIIGCSVAYHLAKLGWTEIVLLEKGRLSGGTTWHAAGLVGQLRTHPSMTRLIRYSTDLYSRLEAETGQATGWKPCGSLTVARTAERMTLLKRVAAMAAAQDVTCELLTPAEADALYPIMRTDDLVGAAWLPGDGKANPADITQALARGARRGGVRIVEQIKVTAIRQKNGRATGVVTDRGDIQAEVVVNCGGQWARQIGRMAGVTVPLFSCEHMYIVTDRIEGVFPDLPCLRDPDGYVYFKEEVGGLLMGGFEPQAKPWAQAFDIPEPFEFQLLPDDWDQFQILMENALIRVPALEETGTKRFINGPESFTADNNYILGEAPELRNFFVAAGFNSMGIASAGGAGMALAEWIANGDPTLDLWPVDIRRFAGFNGNDQWLTSRVAEVLGLHYKMPWPNRELETARPLRRSALYDRLQSKGAVFGSKMGWERVNWFAEPDQPKVVAYAWSRQNWFTNNAREHHAARNAVAVFDQSSFSKFLLQGRDAAAALQHLCANDMDVPVGTSVYTGVLNSRGGFESDLTVQRLAHDRFMLVTGSSQTTRDADWINKHLPEDAHAVLTDVTGAWCVLGVMGPHARKLLMHVSRTPVDDAAFPFGTCREIDIGIATVLAVRRTYVGELGWELYAPVEMTAMVYDTLCEAGERFGLRDAGYYTIESLRMEKGYRAWGRELTPDHHPYEAGLGFAVKLDKAVPFVGQEALRGLKGQPPKRRCVSIVLEDGEPIAYGGELILRDGRPAGETTSAAYGHTLGRAVMLGYVHANGQSVDPAYLHTGTWEVDIGGNRCRCRVSLKPPYDPEGARLRPRE